MSFNVVVRIVLQGRRSEIFELDNNALKSTIQKVSRERYGQECKPFQLETVINAIRGKNTFFLAATCFGKSRITGLHQG
ncbi:hypothetical protein VP01_4466g2 [Puccinia sorghi]|uniref:Uncharacterized protein n=1 Tax=Puccinia sorghi TaxID=27349 RepID=A0A0L6UQ74_9BASI|nr:hypothetical protein VP01_4466g2 [Puccinia sorghi]